MSPLLIFVSLFEFLIAVFCVVILSIVRSNLVENPTVRSIKVKKYIGYVMIAICLITLTDYSYSVYRYFVPANPYNIISADDDQVISSYCDKKIHVVK